MCQCRQLFLFLLNFVVFAVGVGLVAIASLVIDRSSQYGDLTNGIITVPIWTIIIGLIVTFIGFFGCFGAVKKSKCMLYMYAIIVMVLLLAQIGLGIFVLVKQDAAKEILRKGLDDGFSKYNSTSDASLKKSIDLMQSEMHCCGVNNYTDWESILGRAAVTPGCCLPDDSDCADKSPPEEDEIYKSGCFPVFIDWIDSLGIGLGVTSICLGLIQMLCVFCACTLGNSPSYSV